MMTFFYRAVFSAAVWFFQTTKLYRPSRVFDIIGSRAYTHAEFSRYVNTYNAKLSLSPHFHIDRNIILFGCYDRQLHQMLVNTCKPSMVCFDIGSNLGEVALHMAMLAGPEGKVIGIDPNPNAFRRLQEHVVMNNLESVIECLPIAVSNKAGELQLSFPDEGADNQGLGSVVNTSQPGVSKVRTVRTQTIDDLVHQYALQRVDLIKMDTQGSEPLILEGAEYTIRQFAPDIILEISPNDLAFLKMTSVDLVRRIEQYGYALHEFRNGQITKKITSDSIPVDFAIENVYCTAKTL
jgi:FkbM family methyltransferase